MKTDFDTTELKASVIRTLHRYHVVLFALFAIGGLSAATFLLNQTISSSSATDATAAAPTSPTLDTETIKKVKTLSSGSTPLVLPSGRTNPFN